MRGSFSSPLAFMNLGLRERGFISQKLTKHSTYEFERASYQIQSVDSGCDILQRACLLPSGEPSHRGSEPGPSHHRDVSGALGRHARCVRTPN